MDLLTFLRVIVLVTNGVYCFVPRSDFQASDTKTMALPMQQQLEERHQQQLHQQQQQQHQQHQHQHLLEQQNVAANDISVYDPGVGKSIRLSDPIKYLRAVYFGPTANYFQLSSKRFHMYMNLYCHWLRQLHYWGVQLRNIHYFHSQINYVV